MSNSTPLRAEDALYEETPAITAAKQQMMVNYRAIEAQAANGSRLSRQLLDMHHKLLIATTNQDKAQAATAFMLAYGMYQKLEGQS